MDNIATSHDGRDTDINDTRTLMPITSTVSLFILKIDGHFDVVAIQGDSKPDKFLLGYVTSM